MQFKNKNTTNASNLPLSLWQFYKQFMFKDFKFMLTVLAVLIPLTNVVANVLWPYVDKWIIGIINSSVPAGMTLLQHATPTIIMITVLLCLDSMLFFTRTALWDNTKPKITQHMSKVLTNYVHNQSMKFWLGRMSGSVNNQINLITDCIGVFWESGVILGCTLGVLINGAILLNLNKYVAYLFIFAFVFRAVYVLKLRKPIKEKSKEASGASSSLTGKIVDSLANYSIVKYFAGATKEDQALAEPRNRVIKTYIVKHNVERLFWFVPGLIGHILFGVTILFCIMLYQHGKMRLDEIVYTLGVYHSVMNNVDWIVEMISPLLTKIADAGKAYKDLVMPISVVDKPNAPDLRVKKGLIEFRHVAFGYRNRPVLTDLMLRIKPGERVGIVGSSGAGKSTLVNLLMRFYEPKRGHILIDGQDIADVTQDSLRSQIAFIPQDPSMFNRTIGENIGYGKFGATPTEIRKAAKNASADEFIMATEKKYNSLVGERGIKLSGGQKQRIAIARAFLKDAPILVLDEATSALDSETEATIQESFEKLSKGRTTIAIAHRLSTLRNMDRIIVLDKGQIVEQGTHQQLLRKKGKYYQLWKMQSGGFLNYK